MWFQNQGYKFEKFNEVTLMYSSYCILRVSINTEQLINVQNPPELDAPLFETSEAEKGAKLVDPEMQDLQINVF